MSQICWQNLRRGSKLQVDIRIYKALIGNELMINSLLPQVKRIEGLKEATWSCKSL